MTPAPGWYPDASVPGALRWWDGSGWTAQVVVPAGDVPATGVPVEPEPFPTLPLPVAVGAVLALAVPLVASRFVLDGLTPNHWPVPVYFAVAGLLAYGPSVWWWRFAVRRWGSGMARTDIGLSMRRVDAGWGPVAWLACVAAQVAVGVVITLFHIPFTGNVEGVRRIRDHLDVVLPVVLLAVVVAPIVEEIVFRGLILRGLAGRVGPWPAVAVQGVLFGLAHLDPDRGAGNVGLVLVLGAVGVVLGGAALLTRRLAAPMIAHAIINGIAIAIALSGWTPASQ